MEYIKQVLCDDNSIYYDMIKDDFNNNYDFITYRKHYDCINGDVIVAIVDKIINYPNYEVEYYYKNNLAAYIIDSLKAYNKLSLKKAISIAAALKDDKKTTDIICIVLEALFNKRYEMTTMRGYCQDDWITCFYAVDDISADYLHYIEAVLFNTGMEIMIHDEKTTPSCADDVCGYCEYIDIKSSDIKNDIAEFLSIKKDDIKLWLIKNTYTVLKCEYAED